MELFCIAGTCSLAPHILLEEIGEPFTIKLLDRGASEQKAPAYLAINPTGKSPHSASTAVSLQKTWRSRSTWLIGFRRLDSLRMSRSRAGNG